MNSDSTIQSSDTDSNKHISLICFSAAAILLCFLCLTYLGVLLCFLFGRGPLPFVAPIAFIISLIIGDQLGKRAGLTGRPRFWPIGIVVLLTAISIFLAAAFYDLSWDGLWYHQTAVYRMAEDWNPIKKPLISSSPHTQEWIRHYAKGPWYIALAVYKTTNHIEWAKCPTWLALAAMLFSVLAACLDFGMRRRRAIAIALLVSLNPVVTCQLCSYLVDGLLISFLACFTAALFIWFRCRNSLVLVLLITSAILCINSKFSGLVFLCFVSAGGGLYCLIKRRDLLIRYVLTQALIIVLGTAGFGYNPYVTNYIHRGHPFFPFMGTKEYPSLDQSGQNPIDKYETPHNMLRKNRLVCFGYAIFGRPGSQPFMDGQNARLMWPFIVPLKDIGMYYFHELRIAGFGPFFSGAFLFALILLAIALLVPNLPRTIIFLSTITIVASLLISRHAWWARYGPQLWWLPVVPVVAVFWRSHSLLLVRITWGLVALLLVNAFIVAAVHLNWEINSTKTLQQQIEKLRQSGEVEIDFQFFDVPFGRRLQTAGVSYRTVRFNGLPRGQELMSVCPGYPGAIKFRIPKDNQENIKNPD